LKETYSTPLKVIPNPERLGHLLLMSKPCISLELKERRMPNYYADSNSMNRDGVRILNWTTLNSITLKITGKIKGIINKVVTKIAIIFLRFYTSLNSW
jgi:hypothetical protein